MCADERDRIEAAARALSGYGEADWADLADFEQEPYRQQARVGNAAFHRSHREKEMLRAALERQPRSHVVVSPAVGERIERYERDRLAAADAVPPRPARGPKGDPDEDWESWAERLIATHEPYQVRDTILDLIVQLQAVNAPGWGGES